MIAYTTAKPYARAAFETAIEQKKISQWEQFLSQLAVIAADPDAKALAFNPRIDNNDLLKLFLQLLGDQCDPMQQQFLQLLIRYHRLVNATDIKLLFDRFVAAYHRRCTVKVSSAKSLTDEQKQLLSEALIKRLKHEITLQCRVDAGLLGGAVLSIGDEVIDGSIRGKLNRLGEQLRETA